MPRTKVLILTALRIEAAHVAAVLGMRVPKPGQAATGVASGLEIELRLVGMGATHLPTIGTEKPDCVILAGFGGGLSPDLRVGDVVVDVRGEECPLPSGVRRGAIHFSEWALNSAKQKQALFDATQCVAVDMESGPIRRWAEQGGVPLVVIRAISDAAGDSLSDDLPSLVDEFGSPRMGRMSIAILRKPALLLHLLKLARSARTAGKNLGRAVHQMIELRGSDRADEPAARS